MSDSNASLSQHSVISSSFNELESVAKLAARGASYPWSVATEAGRSVRWLAEHDLPGPQLLAGLLNQTDSQDYAAFKPGVSSVLNSNCWFNDDQPLCPILTGLSVVDFAHQWILKAPLELIGALSPGLMLPFVVHSSLLLNKSLAVGWDSCECVCDQGQVLLARGQVAQFGKAMAKESAASVSVRCLDGAVGEYLARAAALDKQLVIERVDRATVNADVSNTLQLYASRTYAPATEASRLLGAGAGVSDND